MYKFKIKWAALLLAVMMMAAFTTGCSSPADEPAPPPVEEPAEDIASLEDIAYSYYADMDEDIYKIPNAELKDRIDAGDDSMLIISIRSSEDYALGHIPGAVNIPFKQMGDYLDELPVDQELIVYCYTGQTAGQTVAILNMYGYDARSLNLGFNKGWAKQENFPIETEVSELPENVTPAAPDAEIAQVLENYFTNMPEDLHKIDSADLLNKMEAGEDMQIVSIRKAEDFAKGHIEGATNIAFGQVHENFDKFATDKPVYVYCYSGQTAGQTVAVLNMLGIDAYSVSSGFNLGWEPEGMPVVQ